MNTTELLALLFGSGGFLSAVSYIVYQACAGRCASHLEINGKSLSIDLQDVQEVLEKVDTPKEREEIRREIQEEMKKTLYKVKSKLQNKLEDIRTQKGEQV